ncbi:hypothetical protein BO221_50620 [Archangium sp. Cb G35]|nr:hypothetical protein BO221_50620 [Archangium sp. Cb G35]
MGLRHEDGQWQPLAVEEIAACGDTKAHGCDTSFNEVSMRAWVGSPLRDPGQLDAAASQFLLPLRRGSFEVDVDELRPGTRRFWAALG